MRNLLFKAQRTHGTSQIFYKSFNRFPSATSKRLSPNTNTLNPCAKALQSIRCKNLIYALNQSCAPRAAFASSNNGSYPAGMASLSMSSSISASLYLSSSGPRYFQCRTGRPQSVMIYVMGLAKESKGSMLSVRLPFNTAAFASFACF